MGAASPAQVRVDARGETGSHREGWVGARGKTLSHGKGIELDTGEPGRREELRSLDSPRADSTIRTPPTNRSLGPPLTQTGMEPSPRFEEPSQECETDEPSPTLSTPQSPNLSPTLSWATPKRSESPFTPPRPACTPPRPAVVQPFMEVNPLALPNHARDDAPDDVENARGAWRQRRMHEARAQFSAKQKAQATAAGLGFRRDEAFLNA